MEEEGKREERKWEGFVQELKKVSYLAASMVAVSLLQYLLQVVSVIIVGHLGALALSSVAIATSITNVTGFSLLSGMAGGLETLAGQAYGAKQYRKLGTYTYSAIISLIIFCLPICVLWIFMGKLLPLLGQDTLISQEACRYSMWLIPALFGAAALKPLTRYLQTQSVILPMLITSFPILCFHTITCWTLVYKLHLGQKGAAIAFSLSTWLNVILLGLYVRFSSACEKTRAPLSRGAFRGIREFLRFGVPSAVMVCLKWWSMELLTLLSGLFKNPKLETSVLSICLTISTLHFTIPYGFGAAVSTRVSNELGAGNPQLARMAVLVALFLAATESVIVSSGLFLSRQVLGYSYSNDRQVVHYISVMTPLICLSFIMDSFQAVLSGVARGSGWQKTGAYINLGSFYLVGLPVAVVLGFAARLRGKGLWIGIVAGSSMQTLLLSIATAFIDWNKLLQVPSFTKSMDQPLLPKRKTEEKKWVLTWDGFVEEIKRVSCMATPMMVASVTLYLLQVVSLMMAGHLSELALSGVSIATSFTNVTGFSLLVGLSGGLETLCGQAYGAEQYKKFGSYTYCAIISLIVTSIPVSVLWIFMDRLLIAIGQDSDISIVACQYAIRLIPALFAHSILQPLLRYFQSQSLIHPILTSTCAALCFHIPLCWALIYKWELGNAGAAFAISASYWLNVILLALYMVFSSSCEKTRGIYWNDIFSSITKFLHFAVPSAVMDYSRIRSFKHHLTTTTLHFYVQYGIGAAGSTRISNELGSGNHQAARVAVQVVLIISITEAAIVSIILFSCRHIFGYAFSNDEGVVDYVAELAPLLCLSLVLDGLQAIFSGIARGCGWQHVGAYVNLGAYYLVATPLAVLLCFVLHLRSKGLWTGLLIGNVAQVTSFAVITALTNWQKQAAAARERIFEGSILADNGLA
ncbi:hypothetical protein SADUNF_Sadunf04G0067100 [Salix dunnii]|uniref:Protein DETOXIFICATION n=1 Tax=Salix dunnii TaxID=1413687 RepID=A0A835KAI3_9ROSI|nr:hypothetical protein SADUNF_Sadunf04G0067100 [Salix dunnii]